MAEFEHKKLLSAQESHSVQPSTNDYFKKAIKLLSTCEFSLILMFIINFLVSFQYYVLVTFIPLYFSSAHGYSDFASGCIFGAFGVIIGLCSVSLSSIIQKIGFKRGLLASCFLGIIGFIMMISNQVYLCLVAVILVQAVSCSLSWPFIEYGVKEFSSVEVRNLSSSLFFMSNYLAGILSGVLIEVLWGYMANRDAIYGIIYGVCIIGLCIAVVCIGLCKPIANVCEEQCEAEGIFRQKRFWRYLALIFLLMLLRSTVFGHLDATLPKYLIRVKGNNAQFGMMLAIHSVTMLIGVFAFTTLTYICSSYSLIIAGGLIGSLGSVLLIFSEDTWAFIIFVICVSIGESIWVPRLLDYTFSVAPVQHEGVYLALSNCPFYFGMIITGGTSGILFNNFCPTSGSKNCYIIWLIIFLSSICIPVLLSVLEPILKEPNIEKTPLNDKRTL